MSAAAQTARPGSVGARPGLNGSRGGRRGKFQAAPRGFQRVAELVPGAAAEPGCWRRRRVSFRAASQQSDALRNIAGSPRLRVSSCVLPFRLVFRQPGAYHTIALAVTRTEESHGLHPNAALAGGVAGLYAGAGTEGTGGE